MLSAVGCYVVRKVTLSQSRGPVSFPLTWEGGGLCDVDKCCAYSRPFPPSSIAETYCRCGEKYISNREGTRIENTQYGEELFVPSYGQLHGLWLPISPAKKKYVIVPGARPTRSTAADIKVFYCFHGHMPEDLLLKTAKQIGVKLQGQLAPCQGCSEAKGIRKPVKPFTYTQAAKPAERCLLT